MFLLALLSIIRLFVMLSFGEFHSNSSGIVTLFSNAKLEEDILVVVPHVICFEHTNVCVRRSVNSFTTKSLQIVYGSYDILRFRILKRQCK